MINKKALFMVLFLFEILSLTENFKRIKMSLLFLIIKNNNLNKER